MNNVYICDAIRTPIGRYGGSLSSVRPDDLAAVPLRALMERNQGVDWDAVDDVILGCANQAGEDNRNVARMVSLLAGLPLSVPAGTINRLCGSGLNAVGSAAQAIKAGDAELIIAGGVESMSRAPFVMGKAATAFSRNAEVYDTTIGWRFSNPQFKSLYGNDSMPETAENLAREFNISREDQDLFAHSSQVKTAAAQKDGRLAREIVPVTISQRKGEAVIVSADEHPRLTSVSKLNQLKTLFSDGTVTAGNASGVNDGAAALLIASEQAVKRYSLKPVVRVCGMSVAGVAPRVMGLGPVPATKKLLNRLGLNLDHFDVLELNEAFAAQSLACIRQLGLTADDPRINPLGGAIALGHPLGMSGARLATTAFYQLLHGGLKRALCTMCIGVGQGISLVLEQP
ncbi:3-oxoadipyl-CoA thiolase [uncultured Desulfuromusa sp.]|uniref:3-oxoadipyl-CoA thiolase n=1 Tax=uncultured Desulfuromusa sp. TaxID=219183 RepID=UPI002AA8092C|nr:3-oxoadipyl-CoA thiolase [uncultured Desulfuromusa sp.]